MLESNSRWYFDSRSRQSPKFSIFVLQKSRSMEKLAFGDCTLEKLDDLFLTRRVFDNELLQSWFDVAREMPVSAEDNFFLGVIKKLLKTNAPTWHEQDLALHFIGPMFSLVNFTEPYRFNLFAERFISSIVDDIELLGKPDEIIATGFAEPKVPFFAFQEYKREKDPNGDPAGQCLAAMLVGQTLNKDTQPIYGCYVIGQNWYFMVLKNRQYEISTAFSGATD